MKAEISDQTLTRLSEKNGKTVVRGVDKAMNQALDKLDELETKSEQSNNSVEISCCDKTEKMASESEEEI